MQFLTTPSGTIAVIDGVLPTASEWSRVARDRALVNLLSMPDKAESLVGLLPFAEYLSRFAVNSATCTDLRALEGIQGLEELLVGGVVTRPPDAEKLTSLQRFGGEPLLLPGIVSLPTILWLNIKWHANVIDVVSDSTKNLTLTEASRLADLAGFARLRNLEELLIHGSKILSLKGLGELTELKSLKLEAVKRVTNTSSVLEAPMLTSLTLEDCVEIDQYEALRSFPGEVRVIGRNPFSREFQASAGPNWTFPPGRPR